MLFVMGSAALLPSPPPAMDPNRTWHEVLNAKYNNTRSVFSRASDICGGWELVKCMWNWNTYSELCTEEHPPHEGNNIICRGSQSSFRASMFSLNSLFLYIFHNASSFFPSARIQLTIRWHHSMAPSHHQHCHRPPPHSPARVSSLLAPFVIVTEIEFKHRNVGTIFITIIRYESRRWLWVEPGRKQEEETTTRFSPFLSFKALVLHHGRQRSCCLSFIATASSIAIPHSCVSRLSSLLRQKLVVAHALVVAGWSPQQWQYIM